MPRGEIPLIVGRLVDGWSAYLLCAVACPAGVRCRALSPHGMVVLLAQVGYHERVGEWYRPVALRPLTS
eukprot:13773650-Alexandrium_andersonii.AAC.1